MICTIKQHPYLFQELPAFTPHHMATPPSKMTTPSQSIASHASPSQASFAELNAHGIPSEKITCVQPEQRRLAMQDVHAVFETQEENTAFVEAKLNDLEAAIAKLDARDRMAYEEARQQNAEYVDSFRLAFLRADHYDATRAAERTVGHFAARLDLFKTTGVLSRDIVPFDLRSEHKEVISSFDRAMGTSRMKLLAECDRAGRPIILINPSKSSGGPDCQGNDELERLLLMLSTVAANLGDVAQMNGIVILWYGHGPSSPTMARDHFKFLSLIPVLPVRVGVVHACHNDSRFTEMFSRMMDVAAPQDILRFQSHYGNHRQCFQSLCRFGIPTQILENALRIEAEQVSPEVGTPPQRDTPWKSSSLPAMMYPPSHEDRRFYPKIERSLFSGSRSSISTTAAPAPASSSQPSKTEQDQSSYLMIDSPSENDIFLGKGKRSERLLGNSLFREAVEQHAHTYNAGGRREKIEVLQVTYAQLKDAGCRFLKGQNPQNTSTPSPVLWMEVSEVEALEKIAMGIRNYQRKVQRATAANKRGQPSDDSSCSISSNDS